MPIWERPFYAHFLARCVGYSAFSGRSVAVTTPRGRKCYGISHPVERHAYPARRKSEICVGRALANDNALPTPRRLRRAEIRINGVAVSFAREHAREDRRRCARRADGDRRQLALRLVRLELHHVAMVLAIRRLVGLLRSRRTGYDPADRRGRRAAIQGGNRMEWWQALGMLIVAVLIAVLIIEWQGQPMEWWQYLLGILIA